jgi:hypothetical protein
VAVPRLQRRDHAAEEGALVLGEQQRGDVARALNGGVDQRELDLRELLGHLGHRVGVGEAHRDDGVVAAAGELLEPGLLGRLVLVLLGGELLEVAPLQADLVDRLGQPGDGGVVE